MKRLLTTLMLSLFVALPSQALTIKGVDVKDTMTLENQKLVLNGAGIRTKWFVEGYIAALYLNEKTSDAQAVIEADEPIDRKSTRLNSSHVRISYAVFCLKKKIRKK